MSRSNVYLQAGNDNGRLVSVGGRGGANSAWAWLNTDNARQSDCGIHVTASVEGFGSTSKERRTKRGDERRSVFVVELPAQADSNCEVRLESSGYKMRELVHVGGLLLGLQAAEEAAAGKPEKAIKTIKDAAKIIAECEEEAAKSTPNVILPGGITMAHALACVEVCRRMATNKTIRKN